MKKNETLHIRIDPAFKKKIQRAAKRQKLTASEFVLREVAKAV